MESIARHRQWPLFDLEVRTPRLTLRYLDDDLAAGLADVAAGGVHDPGYMPFSVPWTDLDPPWLERGVLQFHWRHRGALSAASWHLPFATIVDGEVVGMTELMAEQFPSLRQFGTGSWLGIGHQGRGIGREMRLASLTLGFVGLGAHRAVTAAWDDNASSLGVTRSLGYHANGEKLELRRGAPARQLMFALDADAFARVRRDDIEIVGLDACRELLGLQ